MQEIAKISGSAVDVSNYEDIEKLIEKRYNATGVFIVSVPSNVKNDIRKAIELALSGKAEAALAFKNVYEKFRVNGFHDEKKVLESFNESIEIFELISKIKEIYPALEGQIYLSVEDMTLSTIKKFLSSKIGKAINVFHGYEAGLIVDQISGYEVMINSSVQRGKSFIKSIDTQSINLVGGLTALTSDKKVVRLPEGGSDLVATLLAISAESQKLDLWTNAKGLMSADPGIISNAKKIDILSYNEALEILSFNPNIFNPKAMELLKSKGVRLYINDIKQPIENGTEIRGEGVISTNVVKAVANLDGLAIFTIIGTGLRSLLPNLLNSFLLSNLKFYTVTQNASGSEVNIIIDRKDVNKYRNLIEIQFMGEKIQDYRIIDNVCAVSIIGEGMKGTPGVASRLFGAVAREKINIIMITQGSSELNIGFVINSEDCKKAISAVHKEFIQ
ncbi:MAG: ACT domain-containing protein [Nitrososphaeria archaeon]